MSELTIVVGKSLEATEELVRAALKEQGFGVLTEIDVARVFQDRLGVQRTPLKILGACNPVMANEALTRLPEAALMLPCNVVLDGSSESETRVSIADPTVLMPEVVLADLVTDAKARLRAVLDAVAD
ncbi:MAG TPA: DUF302 domain-containing protein [Acidimicrobiales bacterium]|nr:DUF302 domain-containing protein [Acidimicrobiales bacterium]